MSGYPHNPPGYGYGSPGQPPYDPSHQPGGAPQYPYQQPPYGAPPASHKPDKPPKDDYSSQSYYGAPSDPHKPAKPPKDDYYGAQPYGAQPDPHKPGKPPKEGYYGGSAPQQYGAPPSFGYGNPFAALAPSAFPPGTDPNVVQCFKMADHDGSGLIDDKELQGALSSYNQIFSLRTVHLLMYLFTNTNSRRIGPKEFISVYYSLQSWRAIFDRYDRDRSGKIDGRELQEALLSLGYAVSPVVLDLLVLKFDKTGGKSKAIEYDGFIECCLTVKGLTDKFKAKDANHSGSATFSHEEFMLTILPFIVA